MASVRPPVEGTSGALRRRIMRSREDSGFVLVFCALFLTVLVGVAGFSVDIGNWYLHALRLQRDADAAALAGSVYLPNDFSTAKSTAQTSLTNNTSSVVSTTVTQSALHPTELQVVATETVKNYFVTLLGLDTITISRSAIAEYRPYVPMGSPSNVLGVEYNPSDSWEKAATKGKQNNYWLNMSAPSTAKSTGDRYGSGACSSGTDGCNTSAVIPNQNLDYSPDGQVYVVHVPAGVSGYLDIQAFDPEFAYVGDQCDQNLTGASSYAPSWNTHLYDVGSTAQGSLVCTGDQLSNTSDTPPTATYTLYTPELSPGGSVPVSDAACQSKSYPGYKGAISSKVNPASPSYDPAFVAEFRQWTSVCNMYVNGSNSGDYLLYIHDTSISSEGLNRFALRAGIMTTSADTTLDTNATAQLELFSKGRLVVYARQNTSNVTFYLARINSASAGHTMQVQLFDIGDAAGGASMTLLPASDALNNGSPMTQFDGCTYTPPGSSVYQPTASGCAINNITSSSYNGKILNIDVNIPAGYTCTDADPNSCWTRLALTYGAGSVSDTTSWQVSIDGSPVHLLANN